MQPNNQRAPGQAGEPDEKDADQGAFKPGVSFANQPSDQGGNGELPSWLQDFAGAAGEPDNAANTTAPAAAQQPATGTSWDDPAPPPAAGTQPPATAPQPHPAADPANQFGQIPSGADSGFLSEDDLPEWLRALSTDNAPSAGPAPVAAVASNPVTSNGAIRVPPVSRAWVTASDQPEVSPGANLLSSLVHAIDNRPDAVAVESTVSAPASPANAKSAAKSQAAAPVAPATSASAPASDTASTDAGRSRRIRILAMAAIIVLLLLVILLLSGN